MFLPGATTHGHYQIELECAVCHTESFTTKSEFQGACLKCHGDELNTAEDSHPPSKFESPRNAERTKALDARHCITCHSEHQPGRTGTMGLSIPQDYCFHCHQDIGKERASHQGLAFDSCANAGCHNFHDNRALYEDYLLRHASEPSIRPSAQRQVLAFRPCPSTLRARLNEQTPLSGCRGCHQSETTGWLSGRHGMRVGQGLSPFSVGQSRLSMKKGAAHKQLTCASCHAFGDGGAQATQVNACLSCHNDEHSLAYQNSKHAIMFKAESAGSTPSGRGTSCATCHMPVREDDDGKLSVQHNQNDNLRPNEKMVRSVCAQCHGLTFTLDALADRALVEKNFSGQPSTHVQSVDFAVARDE